MHRALEGIDMGIDTADARWSSPLDQLLTLRAAIKALLMRRLNPRERLERATYGLAAYLPSDFPKAVRARFQRIMDARVAVTRAEGQIFEFQTLSNKERNALQADIFALYEACLMDIGWLNGSASMGGEVYDIVYPHAGAPDDTR
jgi:hypothetical protein